jgi:catechol 2,3-dioxygenase-like lactoylglutathione lyase family enzyme
MLMSDHTPSANFHPAAPILPVADLAASLDYYVRVLGFTLDWQDAIGMASVSRERCTLMLCQGDQGHAGAWVWVGVADADALHDELTARGAIVRHPPTDYPWAREMQIADPDGNVLRLGSDPRVGADPGEWLDMHGIRWAQDSFGTWQRAD